MESSAAEGAMEPDDAREGVIDRAQFGQLYLRYRDQVFRYVRRLSESEDEAADLTALTFERALARLHTFRADGAGFAPWLFRIARNQAFDARRRRRRWIPLQLLPMRQHPREPSTLEEVAIRREASEGISRYVAELSAIQRECLALRYGVGLTALEIGLVIGKSEAATQKLMARALATLKEKYGA
jgi:RNA polymerase sigma-70 factor, ECF subfamily